MGDYNLMYIISIVLKVYCIWHIIQNRRPLWWIIVVLFPLGPLIYFIFGAGRGGAGARRMRQKKLENKNPGRQVISYSLIHDLEKQLENRDTVDTRAKIAEAYASLGDHEKAVEYYKTCLTGFHADDPVLLFGLARSQFALGKPKTALKNLDVINATGRTDYANERKLLRAECLAQLDHDEEAEKYFEEVHRLLSGEEARCKYAKHLVKMGKTEEARKLADEILEHAQRGDSNFRTLNHQWINTARELTVELG